MKTIHLRGILTGLAIVAGCVFCALLGFFLGGGLGVDASEVKIEDIDWISLGKPSIAIDHLLYVDPYSVFVNTIDGKVFVRSIECTSEPCWVVSNAPNLDPTSWAGENLIIAEICEIDAEIKAPPGSVSECGTNTLVMPGGHESEYLVLLDDGTVWVWTHGAYDIDYGIRLFALFAYGSLGIFISVAAYSIFIITFYLLRKKLNGSKVKPTA